MEQFDRFMLICRSGFISAEDSFLQHLSGQLDGTAFKSFKVAARGIFALPGTRAAWRLSSNQYGDEFAKFIEGIMTETPVQPEVDARQHWIDAINSEISVRPG